MGASAAQTVNEIEEIRERLEEEIEALEDRLPAIALWAKRIAGGSLAGSALLFLVRRRRRSHRRDEPVRAIVQMMPEPGEASDGDNSRADRGRSLGWAIVGAAMGAAAVAAAAKKEAREERGW